LPRTRSQQENSTNPEDGHVWKDEWRTRGYSRWPLTNSQFGKGLFEKNFCHNTCILYSWSRALSNFYYVVNLFYTIDSSITMTSKHSYLQSISTWLFIACFRAKALSQTLHLNSKN
jgi:hypothetical protein